MNFLLKNFEINKYLSTVTSRLSSMLDKHIISPSQIIFQPQLFNII